MARIPASFSIVMWPFSATEKPATGDLDLIIVTITDFYLLAQEV